MAKPNYSFEKRQKELARQKKRTDKQKRKQGEQGDAPSESERRPD